MHLVHISISIFSNEVPLPAFAVSSPFLHHFFAAPGCRLDLGAQQCAGRLDLAADVRPGRPATHWQARSACQRALRAPNNAPAGSIWLQTRDPGVPQRVCRLDLVANARPERPATRWQARSGRAATRWQLRLGCQHAIWLPNSTLASSICIPRCVRTPSSTLARHWFARSG